MCFSLFRSQEWNIAIYTFPTTNILFWHIITCTLTLSNKLKVTIVHGMNTDECELSYYLCIIGISNSVVKDIPFACYILSTRDY